MKRFYWLFICVFGLLMSCSQKNDLTNPPEFVGRPPQNAYTGLVKLEDGEIRHYGKGLYISSKDNGFDWDTIRVENGNFYGKQNPKTGAFLRVYSGQNDSVFSIRSNGGIDGSWDKELIDTNGAIMIKPVIYVKNEERAIAAFHTRHRDGCGTYYSDDNGLSWKKSNQVNVPDHEVNGHHKGKRWNHGAVEPTVIELNDGRLWMLIRTAQDNHYESFSIDHGKTWSEPTPSRFYGTITMPMIKRLKNGQILLIWSNTTPLPEREHDGGYWEDVFTNRDAIHAAISDDDGKAWKGFREIYLNPRRNDSLMATQFGKLGSLDRSVHQSEIIETDDNKVLVSLGQHPKFRTLLKLDVNWLNETERFDDFSDGLEKWSYQKYLKGIQGHCTYNRKPGAFLVVHPDITGKKVMHLKTEKDSALLFQNSGGLFNFPAGKKGEISIRMKLNNGFNGMQISLHDRWFNPTDKVAKDYAMFNMEFTNKYLNKDRWHNVKFKWDKTDDLKTGNCSVFVDDVKLDTELPLNFRSINGISYVHIILNSEDVQNEGILIESIKALVQPL